MKQTSCKICGSTEIQQKENSIYCLSCGNKYTIPQNTKEITVNYDKEIKNYYQIAVNAFNNGMFSDAVDCCKKILYIDCNHSDTLFLFGSCMLLGLSNDFNTIMLNFTKYKELTNFGLFIEKTTDMLNRYMLFIEKFKDEILILTHMTNMLNFFEKYQGTFGETPPLTDAIISKFNNLLISNYHLEKLIGYNENDYSMEFVGEKHMTAISAILDLLKNFNIEDKTKQYIFSKTADFYEDFLPDAYQRYAEGRFSSPRSRSYPSQKDNAELRKVHVLFTFYGEYLLKNFTEASYNDREKLCNSIIEHIDYYKDAQYKVGGSFYGITDEGKKKLEELMQKFENFKY